MTEQEWAELQQLKRHVRPLPPEMRPRSTGSGSPDTKALTKPSPARAVMELCISGDLEDFKDNRFKRGLAGTLAYELAPENIRVTRLERRGKYKLAAGKCRLTLRVDTEGMVNFNSSGSEASDGDDSTSNSDSLEDEIEDALAALQHTKWWPAGVSADDFEIERGPISGSVLISIKLPTPMALMFLQLAQQACTPPIPHRSFLSLAPLMFAFCCRSATSGC